MIKHLPSLAILAVAAGIFTAAPAAHADGLYGPLIVSVWTGVNTTDLASLPTPGGPANFVFTYTGPLDFTTSNTANTFTDFFGSNASYMSNFTVGTESALLADVMSSSSPGESQPGATNSYLSFVGNYTGGGTVTATHDDGASLYTGYTGTSYTDTVFSSPDPTTDQPPTGVTSGPLPTGTDKQFDLVYVESNGAPSVLQVTGLSPVPEPGTFGLMALSMIGLAGLAYRGSVFNS